MLETNKVHHLNCIDGMKLLDDDIIDLTGNGFKDCKMNYAGSDE